MFISNNDHFNGGEMESYSSWFKGDDWFKSSVDETEFNEMMGESHETPQSGDPVKLLIIPEGLGENEEGIIVGSFRSNGETFYSIDLDSQQGEGTVDIFLPREDFEITSERSEDELEMLWRGSSKKAQDWFSDNPEDFFAFNIGDSVYVITEDEVGEITEIGQYYTVAFSDGTEGEYGSDEVDYPEPDFLKDSWFRGSDYDKTRDWWDQEEKEEGDTFGEVFEEPIPYDVHQGFVICSVPLFWENSEADYSHYQAFVYVYPKLGIDLEDENAITGRYLPGGIIQAQDMDTSDHPSKQQVQSIRHYFPNIASLEWNGDNVELDGLEKQSDWWNPGQTIGEEEAYDLAWELYGDRPPQQIVDKLLAQFRNVKVRQIEALVQWANKHESDPNKKLKMLFAWARKYPERVRRDDTPTEAPEEPQTEVQPPQSEPVEQSDSEWMSEMGQRNVGNPRLREWAVSSLDPWFQSKLAISVGDQVSFTHNNENQTGKFVGLQPPDFETAVVEIDGEEKNIPYDSLKKSGSLLSSYSLHPWFSSINN